MAKRKAPRGPTKLRFVAEPSEKPRAIDDGGVCREDIVAKAYEYLQKMPSDILFDLIPVFAQIAEQNKPIIPPAPRRG